MYESSINTNNEFYSQIYAENGEIFRSKTAQRTGFNDHYKKYKKLVEKRDNANNSLLRDIRDIHKNPKKENEKSPKYIRTQFEHKRNSGLFGVVGKRSYFVGVSVDSKSKVNMHEAGQCDNVACFCEDCDPGTCSKNRNLPCNSSGYLDSDKETPNIFDIELATEKHVDLEDLKFFVKDTATATNEEPKKTNEEPKKSQPQKPQLQKLETEDVIARIKNAFDNCLCKVCNCMPGEASCRPGCGCKNKPKDKASCGQAQRSLICKKGQNKSETDIKSDDLKKLLADCEQCNCLLCQTFLMVVKTIDAVALKTNKMQCDCDVCQKLNRVASKHCLCKLRNMPCENCKQSDINSILSKAYQQAATNLADSLLNDDMRHSTDEYIKELNANYMKHHERCPCSKCNVAKCTESRRNCPKIRKRSRSSSKAGVSEQSTSQGLKTACKCKKCLDHRCEKMTPKASNKSANSDKSVNSNNDDSASHQCCIITNPLLCTNNPAVYSQRYAKTMQRDYEKHKCRDCYSKKHNAADYKSKSSKRNNDDFLDIDPCRLHKKSKHNKIIRQNERIKNSTEVAAVSSAKTYILSNTQSSELFEQCSKKLAKNHTYRNPHKKSPSPKKSRAIPDFTEEFCEDSIPKCKSRIFDDYLKGVRVDKKKDKNNKNQCSNNSGRPDCYSPKSIARINTPMKTEFVEETKYNRNPSYVLTKFRPCSNIEACSSKQLEKRRETIFINKDKNLEKLHKFNKFRTVSLKGIPNKNQSQTDNGMSMQQNRKSNETINVCYSSCNDNAEPKFQSETEVKCTEQLVVDLFKDMVIQSYDYDFHTRKKDDRKNSKSEGIIRVSSMHTNQEKNGEKSLFGQIKSENLEIKHSNSSQSYKTTCDSDFLGETTPIDIECRDAIFVSKVEHNLTALSKESNINLVSKERIIFETVSIEMNEQCINEMKPHTINELSICKSTCNMKKKSELIIEFGNMETVNIINDHIKLENHTENEISNIEIVDMQILQNVSNYSDDIEQTDVSENGLKMLEFTESTTYCEKVEEKETCADTIKISCKVIDGKVSKDSNKTNIKDESNLSKKEFNKNEEEVINIDSESGYSNFDSKNQVDGLDTSNESRSTVITVKKCKHNDVYSAISHLSVKNENHFDNDNSSLHTIPSNEDSIIKTTDSKIIENSVREFFRLSHISRLKNDRELFHKFIETIQKYEIVSDDNQNDVTLRRAGNENTSNSTGLKENKNVLLKNNIESKPRTLNEEELLQVLNNDCVTNDTCGGKVVFGEADQNTEFVQIDIAHSNPFHSRSVSTKSLKDTLPNISSFGLISAVSSFQSDETVVRNIASSEVAMILDDILNRAEYRVEAMRLMEASSDQDELDEYLIANNSQNLLSASSNSAYLVARVNELGEDILDDSSF